MNVRPEPAVEIRPVMSENRVALLCALMVMVGPASLSLFTPAMPDLVRAFGTTDAAVKMTMSLYFAGFAAAQLVCGPLSDGLGRKPIIVAFMGIYVLASLAALLAPSVEMLIAARFVQGIGGAAGVAISRALVRDLFTSEASARIMNLITILMGLGPALAPSLGGLMVVYLGWQSVFAAMLVAGLLIIVLLHLFLVETVVRDTSRIRPRALLASYRTLLTSPYFIAAGLTVGGAMGALYTQATLLPFILMNRVGMTAAEYGVGMLMQSGCFFMGSIITRMLMAHLTSLRVVMVGLACIAVGSVLTATLLHIYEPTFLLVMVPIGIYVLGIPMVMPGMSTAALQPYPHMAGAASALMGFMQMGGGLIGGVISAAFTDQVFGLTVVVPLFGIVAIASFWIWTRLAMPAEPQMPPRS